MHFSSLSLQTVEEQTSYDSESGERTTMISRVSGDEKITTVIKHDSSGIEKFENVEKLTSDVIKPHIQRIEQTPPPDLGTPYECDVGMFPSLSAASGGLLSRVKESFGFKSESSQSLNSPPPTPVFTLREKVASWKPKIMARLFRKDATPDDE